MPRYHSKKGYSAGKAGVIILVVLLLAAGALAVSTLHLAEQAHIEASRSPTPAPVMESVMQITPVPGQTTASPLYKAGSRGAEVEKIQMRLKELNYYTGAVDGQYGAGTQAAVTAFQRQHALDADGVAGPLTLDALYSSSANRAAVTAAPLVTVAVSVISAQDPSLPLIISRAFPVGDDYTASDLILMEDVCDPAIVMLKYSGTLANREAAACLMDMLTAAHTDGITVWQVSAAYRTWQMQDDLFNAQVADYMRNNRLSETDAVSAARLTVADPGTSEHMTGLAFDITVPGKSFKGTEQANWIAANCWDYGFILRYEEDKQRITGFLAEPWHIRYVGKEHSIPIRDAGMCLEEYVQMRQGGAR